MKKGKQNSNIFKKMISAFAVVLCVTLLTPGVAQAKSQVALNKAKVTVCTGKTYTLKMTGISKKVKWSTSDKNVVAISKKSGKKSEKVTIKGINKGTATVAAKVKVGKKTKTFKCQVKVAGHKYSKVSYKWNKDYSKCTASKKCTRCGKTLKQTVKTTGKTTTKATCTETGKKKYTAQFTKYSFGTKTKSVTIKAKGHKVNTDKKISYKWNSGYSKCTATSYCKYGGEKQTETVKASKKTTPATKTSEGKTTYTATFKTKGLQAQTKKVSIPKLAYLTLNGKEVNQISVGYGKPVTVTLCNDTIASTEFTWYGTKTTQYIYCPDGDLNNQIVKEKTETKDWPAAKTYGNINGNQLTIKTKDKPTEEENLTLTITTSRGQTIQCAVNVEFTPGEYNFGEIDTTPDSGYQGYGKLKGTYAKEVTYDYIMDCNTRAEWEEAYNFYNHNSGPYGECDLNQKSGWIKNACSDRADYYNQYMDKLISQYGSVSEIYANCDDEMYNYLIVTSSDSTGFNGIVESQEQVDKIVAAWANKYNNGVMPSWYYSTVYSDWAEWSGADLGYNTDSYYEFRGLN